MDVDPDAMLRNVTSNKFDDLEELRRMIKKTENNLKMYSHSVGIKIIRFIKHRLK